ncbi:ABC transporter ATP-binding protein [Leeuwenhoekiella sp. MAR_2009_132]|uniref:ABC transporter ATP-binding protein n=1 Tax=Leeuwenhoekiella sp. MAR_2009_132 TaxID=1392489 RepID=UPI00048C1C6A|nr:ABC transporter ATP-binding protein [Leeuwenhoekiella sp. MAR_2009_132]
MEVSQKHTNLSCENLSVGYCVKAENKTIVSEVTLDLFKGDFTAMVGINGSGKSTLLRTLAGLQKPLSGNVYLDNKTLDSYPALLKSKLLSLVLTNQQISKNLTVLELVTLGRQPYTNWLGSLSKADKTHILDAIEATELGQFKNTSCFELSDGQLQRALIARALAQDTDIILLDEPTTHLDLHHKASIFLLLKKIAHTKNKTILCTTHDIELVLSLCDKMIVLKEGKSHINTPKRLIKSGIFENLFPDDKIGFDMQSQRFFIR